MDSESRLVRVSVDDGIINHSDGDVRNVSIVRSRCDYTRSSVNDRKTIVMRGYLNWSRCV